MSKFYTDEYKALIDEHRERVNPLWGYGRAAHRDYIREVARKFKCRTMIDYGCGQGKLLETVVKHGIFKEENIQGYDPFVPRYSTHPEGPADMLLSTDALEHIEPEFLDDVLLDMRRLTGKVAYFNIGMCLSGAYMPDGRDFHLITEGEDWWNEQLLKYYSEVTKIVERTTATHYTCYARP